MQAKVAERRVHAIKNYVGGEIKEKWDVIWGRETHELKTFRRLTFSSVGKKNGNVKKNSHPCLTMLACHFYAPALLLSMVLAQKQNKQNPTIQVPFTRRGRINVQHSRLEQVT